jgi:hypothetical protein
MATSTVHPSQATLETSQSANRTLALVLVWGGWMLFILGWWLGTKHDDLSRVWIFLLWALAAGSLVSGIWQYLVIARPAASPGEKQAVLARQRRLLAWGVMAGGLALIGLGIYLAFSFKLAAFGEVVGMFLLGLLAVAGGRNLLKASEPKPDVHPFFDLLRRRHSNFGFGMLGVGLALALGAVALVTLVKIGDAWLSEMAWLLLLGFVLIGGGIYLTLSRGEDLTTAKMRVFVLAVGGAAGLILALGALARAILWRDEVFGGMRAWQGDRGWQLWLCAYVELIGLALMFASLLLARSDIRSSVVLRRALYGYNAVLTGLLLLAMLVVFNIVVFALFPMSFEWSKSRGAHTLSVSTKNLLRNLREPTTIYVFLPRNTLDQELGNFLDNCQSVTSKIQVRYVSPDADFVEYNNLAKRFPEIESIRSRFGKIDRGVLLVYGELPADTAKKAPHKHLPFSSLVEEKPIQSREGDTKVTVLYKGEAEIMRELSFLAQERKKRKIYFVQGDGELNINGMERGRRRDLRMQLEDLGCGVLVKALRKEQFEVQGLSFAEEVPKDKTQDLVYAKVVGPEKRKEVPDDADALVIAGAGADLGPKTLDALERYMDRGGRMLVYLDIIVDDKNGRMIETGLETFLRKYGVLVGNEFAIRYPPIQDPRMVFATVPRDTTNELAKTFEKDVFPLDTVRAVRPDPATQKYKVDVVLALDRNVILGGRRFFYVEESNVRVLADPLKFLKDLVEKDALPARVSAEPIPVAVAVSEKLVTPGGAKESLKPRLFVLGDAECLSNAEILQTEQSFPWFASALEWMSEKQGLIGPRAKETSSYTINPNVVNVSRLSYLPGWLMTISILSLGAGIWVVRRR